MLGCAVVPRQSDDRGGHDGRGTRPCGLDQETGAEERIQEARRERQGPPSVLGCERRRTRLPRMSGNQEGTTTTRSCWGRGSRGCRNRRDAFCSSGSAKASKARSSSVFRKDHDPVASKLAVCAESNPGTLAAHTLLRMADHLSREGCRRDWRPVDCPPITTSHLHQILQPMYPAFGPRNLPEVGAADVATQRYKANEVATQDGDWRRASHVELLPDAMRLLMARDELELIIGELRHEMPLIKFLDEGRAPWGNCSHAKCKGQDKGKHSDKRKGRPQRASPKENPAESKASSV